MFPLQTGVNTFRTSTIGKPTTQSFFDIPDKNTALTILSKPFLLTFSQPMP